MSADAISLWINPLKPLLSTDEKLVLEAPNRLHERIVRDRYLQVLCRCARALKGRNVEIDFVSPNGCAPQEPLLRGRMRGAARRTRYYGVPLNPNYIFQKFVVGRCNITACSAALSAVRKPAREHNPLFITGLVGLGKTHLLQAIGMKVLAEEKHGFIHMPIDRLVDEIIESFKSRMIAKMRKKLESTSFLLIDDVHFLSGRNQIQEELFHIFNGLSKNGGQIVLTSDRLPKDIPHLQQRLVSRFESGSVVTLTPPALSTRIAILESKSQALGMRLSRRLLMLIASRVRTNIRRMEGALNMIAAHIAISRGCPDEAAIERLLSNGSFDDNATVTISGIQHRVADHFSIRISSLMGKNRHGQIVFPRQLAMYLCRKLLGVPYADIGAAFSGRDHGTALHSCRVVEELLLTNAEAREKVEEIITSLRK